MAEQVHNQQNVQDKVTLIASKPEDLLLQINDFRKSSRSSLGTLDSVSGAALGRNETFLCVSHNRHRPTGKTILQFSVSQAV